MKGNVETGAIAKLFALAKAREAQFPISPAREVVEAEPEDDQPKSLDTMLKFMRVSPPSSRAGFLRGIKRVSRKKSQKVSYTQPLLSGVDIEKMQRSSCPPALFPRWIPSAVVGRSPGKLLSSMDAVGSVYAFSLKVCQF